ncbi:MAG: tRNA-dihydrouridine synthase family protein [Victivallaceae bacterium]|nr:tRNA-dihydrouridine synthase family protein [Victivallaceae bacterium]
MHPAFVLAANELGLVDVWMTPFFRVTGPRTPRRVLAGFLAPFMFGGVPVHVQLMGRDPDGMLQTAESCLELGCAGINLNFCCPSGTVVRHGAGGGWLRDIPGLMALTAVLRRGLPEGFLSVKLRAGFDHSGFAWYSELAGLGIDAVFLHFRTVSEQYRQLPFSLALERFAAARERLGAVPLFANGDIDTPEKLQACHDLGCAGVMAARGWLRRPSLLKEMTGHECGVTDKQLFFKVLGVAKCDESLRFNKGRAVELGRMLLGSAAPVLAALEAVDGDWKKVTEF